MTILEDHERILEDRSANPEDRSQIPRDRDTDRRDADAIPSERGTSDVGVVYLPESFWMPRTFAYTSAMNGTYITDRFIRPEQKRLEKASMHFQRSRKTK
jgi:hypothetical protein